MTPPLDCYENTADSAVRQEKGVKLCWADKSSWVHVMQSVTSSLIPGSSPSDGAKSQALFTALEKQLREWIGCEEPPLVKSLKASMSSPLMAFLKRQLVTT